MVEAQSGLRLYFVFELANLRSCEVCNIVSHTVSGGGLLTCSLLEGCLMVGGENTHSHCVFISPNNFATSQVRKFATSQITLLIT